MKLAKKPIIQGRRFLSDVGYYFISSRFIHLYVLDLPSSLLHTHKHTRVLVIYEKIYCIHYMSLIFIFRYFYLHWVSGKWCHPVLHPPASLHHFLGRRPNKKSPASLPSINSSLCYCVFVSSLVHIRPFSPCFGLYSSSALPLFQDLST